MTRQEKINDYLRGSLKVVTVTEKIMSNRLARYRHVPIRKERHATRRVSGMNVEGNEAKENMDELCER